MTDASTPISRPLLTADLPEGLETEVSFAADDAERAALARRLGVPGVSGFTGKFQILKKPKDRLRVEGAVHARLTRVCVVTLEPFDVEVNEPIAIDFASAADAAAAALRVAHEPPAGESIVDQSDPPDPIVDGRIDLGVVATEFLALALDPYPRKPGAIFASAAHPSSEESPFAELKRLKLDES